MKPKEDSSSESIFTTLRELPLLKGVSQARLQEVVGNTRFHFLKYAPGETIAEADEPCTHIKFVVSGSVRLSVANASGRFSVDQTLTAPQVLAPDYLFGRSPRYPGSIVAIDRVGIMQIAKEDYRQMLSSDPVFLFNFLNTVSTNAQKGLHGILAVATGSLEERIAFWIISMTQPGSTDIVLRCQHRDLYALFGVSRHSYFTTLDSMKAGGIIDYDSSREIRILSRPELLRILLR